MGDIVISCVTHSMLNTAAADISAGIWCMDLDLLQVRAAEEDDLVVLEQLLSLAPCPPVALVALLKEGLDVRGLEVEKRLAGLQVRYITVITVILSVSVSLVLLQKPVCWRCSRRGWTCAASRWRSASQDCRCVT
jgi:hypothetical protein